MREEANDEEERKREISAKKDIAKNESIRFPPIDWANPEAERLYGFRPSAHVADDHVDKIAQQQKKAGDDSLFTEREKEYWAIYHAARARRKR